LTEDTPFPTVPVFLADRPLVPLDSVEPVNGDVPIPSFPKHDDRKITSPPFFVIVT